MQREISDAWLRTLAPPKAGRLEIWDSRVRGLVLRLTPSGAATWSVRLRTRDGKRSRPALGRWPHMGISEARKTAHATIAQIEKGADPVAEKRAARAERVARASAPTVADRLKAWHAAKAADWSDRHAESVERIADGVIIPEIGKRILADTTRADWTGIVANKRKRAPAMASLIYRVSSAFLNHCDAAGWAAPLLPRKGLATLAPPVASRARTLDAGELAAVWRATEHLTVRPRLFARLLITTGAREMEAADIATGEIDREAARWIIPAKRAKNRHAITLPLPRVILDDLGSIWPEHESAGDDWRLLGAVPGGGLRGFSKLKARLDEKSGVHDWTFHDLRRTCRTGMSALGIAPHVAEAALNHVSGRTALERTYDRHDFASEIIAALEAWQRHIIALVSSPERQSGKPTAPIIPFRRVRP